MKQAKTVFKYLIIFVKNYRKQLKLSKEAIRKKLLICDN